MWPKMTPRQFIVFLVVVFFVAVFVVVVFVVVVFVEVVFVGVIFVVVVSSSSSSSSRTQLLGAVHIGEPGHWGCSILQDLAARGGSE